jgi:hypothetical protein
MIQETKTAKAVRLMKEGKTQEALSIAKGFRLGLTKPLQVKIARAHECMIHPEFYEQLGYNPPEVVKEGVEVFYKWIAHEPPPEVYPHPSYHIIG